MFQGGKVLIYGKGRVGNALKEFCDSLKIVSEIRDDTDNISDFSPYDIIVPSPGIAPSHRIYTTGKIIGELDFVYQYLPKGFKILSITGTDGKSTTAWILYNLLKQEYGDERVFLSGNFEIPFSETVRLIREKKIETGYIVLEVSSFMAYNIGDNGFRSTHSIFTNFETDHLNWHTDLQDYFDSKMKIFRTTTGISCVHDQVFSRAQEFGLRLPDDIPNIRIFGKDNGMEDRTDGEDIIISGQPQYRLSETQFSGMHNALNILSATLITNALGIDSQQTKTYLENISGLSHRLELVTEKNGIRYIDDSKSTSAQSLIAALGSFGNRKVVLIAGGSDKGDRFENLGPWLKEKVQHAELIGATREILGEICKMNGISYHYSDSMDEAVNLSHARAKKGDSVLLSPGCASFGMFRDYLDRAEKFRSAVKFIA